MTYEFLLSSQLAQFLFFSFLFQKNPLSTLLVTINPLCLPPIRLLPATMADDRRQSYPPVHTPSYKPQHTAAQVPAAPASPTPTRPTALVITPPPEDGLSTGSPRNSMNYQNTAMPNLESKIMARDVQFNQIKHSGNNASIPAADQPDRASHL